MRQSLAPDKLAAAQMCVFLASGMIREYSHFDPDVQQQRRAALLDTCVVFAVAGVDRLLTQPG